MGAEEQCKRTYGSHLASVNDLQTDHFIARQIARGEAIWIGARQTFGSKKGSWAWADGCSPWNYTPWENGYPVDGVLERECAFLDKTIAGNITRWRAGKCEDTSSKNHQFRKQFRYVCSISTCQPIDTKTTMDPITFKIVVCASVGGGLLLLIAAAVFICKKMKKRQTTPEEESTDQNPLYGQYYKVDAYLHSYLLIYLLYLLYLLT